MLAPYGIRYANGEYDRLWFHSREEAGLFARREAGKKRRRMALRERGGDGRAEGRRQEG